MYERKQHSLPVQFAAVAVIYAERTVVLPIITFLVSVKMPTKGKRYKHASYYKNSFDLTDLLKRNGDSYVYPCTPFCQLYLLFYWKYWKFYIILDFNLH